MAESVLYKKFYVNNFLYNPTYRYSRKGLSKRIQAITRRYAFLENALNLTHCTSLFDQLLYLSNVSSFSVFCILQYFWCINLLVVFRKYFSILVVVVLSLIFLLILIFSDILIAVEQSKNWDELYLNNLTCHTGIYNLRLRLENLNLV